jgi:hypothetical protein
VENKEAHFLCPVCGFPELTEPPYNAQGNGSHEICPCCGFEYGFDDHSEGMTHQQYLKKWLSEGAEWFDPEAEPEGWDLEKQLQNLG